MRLRFEQLGRLRGGFPARAGAELLTGPYRFRALQAKDLRPDGSIAWEELTWMSAGQLADKYRVVAGDVLIPLRSASLRATVFRGEAADVVAVGPWALLTPNRSLVDADFLAWYLGQPVATAGLASLVRGTNLQFLSLKSLRAFEVEIPSLAVQRRIVGAVRANARIVDLERQLAAAREKLVESISFAALRRALELDNDG